MQMRHYIEHVLILINLDIMNIAKYENELKPV